MKRLIITTIILIIATAVVTVVYFKNLNPQAQQTSRVIHSIPDNSALIFEFNNDAGFYDIYKDSELFNAIAGRQTISEFDTLRKQLLLNPALERFFDGQHVFVSLHPLKNNQIELLFTTSASKGFDLSAIDNLAKDKDNGLLITPLDIEGKKGYTIYSGLIKKRFYLFNKEDDVYTGSFSKDLAIESAKYKAKKEPDFVLLPDQQNANSLGNLYVNYSALNPLFDQLFQNKNADIFKSFRLFPGLSALNLNFKSNAFLFSGTTNILNSQPASYLSLFMGQQPVVNQLKNIFPSSTAYSINFAVSNVSKFKSDLSAWQTKAGLQTEKDQLFKQVKTETGINLIAEFNQLLGSEFAIVTTRYHEKYGIILLKDGAKFKSLMNNLSTNLTANTGQFNYNKLPFFLLGDAYSIFKKPYFMVIDSYLILANSTNELSSFSDSYINRKFSNKTDQYSGFDNLLAERSNVAYFVNIKNIMPLLKDDLNASFINSIEATEPGLKGFYAAACQFTGNGKSFYTNFCMQLNVNDTTSSNGSKVAN